MEKQMQEFIDPLVMARELMLTDENRYIWPIAVFKEKFKVIL